VAVRDVCEKDPQRLGNRGSHRYSFAGSHKQSVVEFSVMADSQPVLEVLAEIFESPDFTCDGVGGDFVLPVRLPSIQRCGCTLETQLLLATPICDLASDLLVLGHCAGTGQGCVQYQHLHRDMGEYLADSSGKLSFLDMPTSRVSWKAF
jgi:hypothetical protein